MNDQLNTISFSYPEESKLVLDAIYSFMEDSIRKGIYSKRKMSYRTHWDSDTTVLLFQELLSVQIEEGENTFPLVQDFTLVGNHEVQFTITESFFEYYLEHPQAN